MECLSHMIMITVYLSACTRPLRETGRSHWPTTGADPLYSRGQTVSTAVTSTGATTGGGQGTTPSV